MQIQETAEKSQASYDHMRKAYLDEQAGILAQDLIDGQACPVCGATHHPHPANISTEAPTKEQLEQAEELADQSAKEAGDASRKAGELRGRLEGQEQLVMKMASELLGDGCYDSMDTGLAVGNDFKEIAGSGICADSRLLKYPGNAGSAAAGDESRAGSFAGRTEGNGEAEKNGEMNWACRSRGRKQKSDRRRLLCRN